MEISSLVLINKRVIETPSSSVSCLARKKGRCQGGTMRISLLVQTVGLIQTLPVWIQSWTPQCTELDRHGAACPSLVFNPQMFAALASAILCHTASHTCPVRADYLPECFWCLNLAIWHRCYHCCFVDVYKCVLFSSFPGTASVTGCLRPVTSPSCLPSEWIHLGTGQSPIDYCCFVPHVCFWDVFVKHFLI